MRFKQNFMCWHIRVWVIKIIIKHIDEINQQTH